MNKIKYLLKLSFLVVLCLSACSYEKINSPEQKKFHIVNISVDGEKRTAFLVRKKINRFSNSESENKIQIKIKIDNKSEIQEKNIQNKVTRYKLTMIADVEVDDLVTNQKYKRVYSASQSYNVEDRYSATLNNSKEANINLIEVIVSEILDQLKIFYS